MYRHWYVLDERNAIVDIIYATSAAKAINEAALAWWYTYDPKTDRCPNADRWTATDTEIQQRDPYWDGRKKQE